MKFGYNCFHHQSGRPSHAGIEHRNRKHALEMMQHIPPESRLNLNGLTTFIPEDRTQQNLSENIKS
jgi:hypothetical protein